MRRREAMTISTFGSVALNGRFAQPLMQVDHMRLQVAAQINEQRKKEMSQYFTPMVIARFMASLFSLPMKDHLSLLDPAAGIGSLLVASTSVICEHPHHPSSLHITAVEIDQELAPHLQQSIDLCQQIAQAAEIHFSSTVIYDDFITFTVDHLANSLFTDAATTSQRFDLAILNPPYRKIQTTSRTRTQLRQLGIETSNIYAGFLYAAMRWLTQDGKLVALTPRSFCNGPYFRAFRHAFLRDMALLRLHLFDSRREAFDTDAVLQEHMITVGMKSLIPPKSVCISTSTARLDALTQYEAAYDQVVHPEDKQHFIRIIPDEQERCLSDFLATFHHTLADLGIEVSTGRVVDFRARSFLCKDPALGTVPLLYPEHLRGDTIQWPKRLPKKPNALLAMQATQKLLVPNEDYVLVKRFTAKEEARRITALHYPGGLLPGSALGIENHLNYFHHKGHGLDPALARGLALYLNSTWVDTYFRQFSGHTQVNATDLRALRYPSREQLRTMGSVSSNAPSLSQHTVDQLVLGVLQGMTEPHQQDALQGQKRAKDAEEILRLFGLLRGQLNRRSALVLLALLHLSPQASWDQAANPLIGITPIMDFIKAHYGVEDAPNTRETIRRQTIHQFVAAGLVLKNPDDPSRPTNSPDTVYQIERSALELLRTFGSDAWQQSLDTYLASTETLKQRYIQERAMNQIPINIAPGMSIVLSPGGQNILIERIIHDFGSRFAPGGKLLYIGDAADKFAYFDEQGFADLGIHIESHGKMPDVILYHHEKHQLFLIEAVTSHGPIDVRRKEILQQVFHTAHAELLFITAFLGAKALAKYLSQIAWETEVWLAESPSHLIHFDGERFLETYEPQE
jgi:adenine-specific DNA-methyltransferase